MLGNLLKFVNLMLLFLDNGVNGRVDTAFEDVVIDLLDTKAGTDVKLKGLLQYDKHLLRLIFEPSLYLQTVRFGIVKQFQY